MAARDDEHASHRQVLPDHQAEFDDFGVLEMLAELRRKRSVYAPEISSELLCVANRQCLARVELTLGFGQMDLSNRLFVEALTRRRRVACEQSGIAFVDRGDLEPCQFLDPRRNDTLLMSRPEERKEALEEIGKQRHHIHPSSALCRWLFSTHRESPAPTLGGCCSPAGPRKDYTVVLKHDRDLGKRPQASR